MPIDITMPALSPTMEFGTLSKWLIKIGDAVEPGDIIAEIETDKATMEVEAVDEGVVEALIADEGTENIKVGAIIATISGDEEDVTLPISPKSETASNAGALPTYPPKTEEVTKGSRLFATPLARRLAAENNVDLHSVLGTGPKGRITKSDVMTTKPRSTSDALTQSPASESSEPTTDTIRAIYAGRAFEEVQLDSMRRTIAARLTEAKQTIPHFYLRRDIQLDALLKFRSELNGMLAEKGQKISVNDFVIKASALALRDVPDCNAAWAGDRILKFKASDIAVAVAVEGGLFTPVIRDAEAKSLSLISNEMKDLADRARQRRLAPQDYQGGSFAISNLGMMGIENFDAVINPPHGSILAVGAGVKRPIVNDNDIAIATVMSLTLSVDHRVIDGALGAEFLAAIKGYIEAPLTMLV